MIKKEVSSLIKILVISFVGVFFCSTQLCYAAFSLSVEPFQGGYDLRFGKVDTQDVKVVRELTITVTTDIGKQYRVFQRLERPLTTPDGVEVDRNKFKMYTLINSNSKGTLERIEEFPVMLADTVLYTSNTAGEGDAFKVVYTLEPSIEQVAGSYYGRMLFILIPIDSTQEQVVETINMYADLTNEGAVEISTNTGFKSIRISSRDLDKIKAQYPFVLVSVKGNLGTRYRIYQQLAGSQIKGVTGEQFDLTKVTYEVSDVKSGAVGKKGDLSDLKSKSLVYVSDDLGSGNDIKIEFEPTADFAQQKANRYVGSINYYLELDKTTAVLEPGFIDAIDVEFEIEQIFKIIATSIYEDESIIIREGVAILQFGDLSYKAGTRESKVLIKVESNLGRPYLVTQKLMGSLQNEEGYKIPDEFFTFLLDKEEDTGAILKFDSETVIEPGKDTTLFVSNNNGDSDEFEITYKLRVTGETRGGDYSTGVSYSLSEL